jgi:hypothetical protein
MEVSHLSYEGDQQDDNQDKDIKRRFSPINPVTKKVINGWRSPAEAFSKPVPAPERRMPVSIVAPEGGNEHSRTISHEAAFHSDAWLGGEVKPPEYQSVITPTTHEAAETPAPATEDDAFQQLLRQAGYDDLDRGDRQSHADARIEGGTTAPAQVEQQDKRQTEYVPHSVAKKRALIAYAAGVLTGSRVGDDKNKVRGIVTKTLEQIPEQPEDPFNREPETHIERDAWHSIVVDKYGREDVNARVQYGKAFQQERREVLPSALSDDTPTTSNDDVQAPPTVFHNAQDVTQAVPVLTSMLSAPAPQPQLPAPYNTTQSLPAGLTQPQLSTGPLTQGNPQHLLPAHAKAGISLLLSPWVWLVAGLLLLVFFAASLIG